MSDDEGQEELEEVQADLKKRDEEVGCETDLEIKISDASAILT